MFVALEGDSQLGGVCGYMSPYLDTVYQYNEQALFNYHQQALNRAYNTIQLDNINNVNYNYKGANSINGLDNQLNMKVQFSE